MVVSAGTTANISTSIKIAKKNRRMKMKTEYKMGLGLPRGSKVIVKAGNRQADITLVEQEDGHIWRLQIDRDLPETEYPTLENAILSAETLFREVI
jgi:hypothetical protein